VRSWRRFSKQLFSKLLSERISEKLPSGAFQNMTAHKRRVDAISRLNVDTTLINFQTSWDVKLRDARYTAVAEKYRGILFGGIDGQYTYRRSRFILNRAYFCAIILLSSSSSSQNFSEWPKQQRHHEDHYSAAKNAVL